VSKGIIVGLAIAATAGALAVGGCGDDDDETTASSTDTATETTASGGGGSSTLDVSETDFAIDPADPTVEAGTVTINVTNDGETTHNLEVEGPDDEVELDADLAPGESGSMEVDLSEPGTYEWYCPVGNHADMGMEGEITVE
jgi:plastocyanin